MKEFWVDLSSWDKELATAAIEGGATAILCEKADDVRKLGRIKTISADGDLVLGIDVFETHIKDTKTAGEAAELSKKGYTIVHTTDWTVIPLENLVAGSDRIIAAAEDAAEVKTALGVLEKGVAGIILKNPNPEKIREVSAIISEGTGGIGLETFTVTSVSDAGMGDRVCVDTCTLMKEGEGMLIGNTSSAFLLVHAETLENPYVAPRPFRVNAGAVHAYAMMENMKTSYLSEIKSGDRVLIADRDGKTSGATVGRVKIEKRPMLLIKAESGGKEHTMILQNAETIRLVKEGGSPVSVISIKPGDKILGHIEKGGRHFGMAVDESILEK
jgi:3-dehydroquinate synthase II